MTASQLLAVDLVLAVLAAGGWTAAAFFAVRAGVHRPPASTRSTRKAAGFAALCLAAAVVLVLGRIAVLPPLMTASWWFASERATTSLPLTLVPTVFAAATGAPYIWRTGRAVAGQGIAASRTAILSIVIAAIGAAASLLVTLVLGPFPAAWTIVVLLFFVAAGSILASLLLFPRRSNRKRSTKAAVAVASLMTAAAVGTGTISWLDSRAADGKVIGAGGHHNASPTPAQAETTSVTRLTDSIPPGAAVRHYELTARIERVTLPSGASTEAWTFGSVPGPALEAQLGEVLEVVLHNRDVGAGVTLHWHGYDVPNAMDGVAGATQDAVLPGQSMTYRFIATQSGTYWYHTHQDPFEGVKKGLYGSLVVTDPATPAEDTDLVVAGHTLNGLTLLEASDRLSVHAAPAGTPVRLRLINTDSLPQRYFLAGAAFRVAAVDGTAVHEPQEVSDTILRIGAGGRLDVIFRMPDAPVTLHLEAAASAAVVLHPPGQPAGSRPSNGITAKLPAGTFADAPELDLLTYGQPLSPQQGAPRVTREEVFVLDRQFRFVDGIPLYAFTVNGATYPNIPALVVAEGDVVKLTLVNRTAEPHPMHPHGHHVQVLSTNGVAPAGSPLLLDTVDVLPGDVWEVLLTADNPGIWMDHCHNLEHAAQGMMMLLQYEGITSPYVHGGHAHNKPE